MKFMRNATLQPSFQASSSRSPTAFDPWEVPHGPRLELRLRLLALLHEVQARLAVHCATELLLEGGLGTGAVLRGAEAKTFISHR